MAPVQVAGAARRGKSPQWTPESVIREIQHFVEAHGEVPRLGDFDPGQAKFYPGDGELLAEKDAHADHYEVIEVDLDVEAMRSRG